MEQLYRIIDTADPSYIGGERWMTALEAQRKNAMFRRAGSTLQWVLK